MRDLKHVQVSLSFYLSVWGESKQWRVRRHSNVHGFINAVVFNVGDHSVASVQGLQQMKYACCQGDALFCFRLCGFNEVDGCGASFHVRVAKS